MKALIDNRVKHGAYRTRLYKIWADMKQRCNNPNHAKYKSYGARGIKVCTEWKDFYHFREWALCSGYSDILTLDRIDNDKGYYPDNCRWADRFTQQNNTRRNHLITYRGETKTLAQWIVCLGLTRSALSNRLKHGWSIEKALSTPVKAYKERKK